MTFVKKLVREAHHRSLWQVLSVYLVGSWGVLQVVESITENAGLPDWVPPFTIVLLLIGLPIVLATAFVQEGAPGSGAGSEGEDTPLGKLPEMGPGAPGREIPDPSPSRTGSAGDDTAGQEGGGEAGGVRHRLFTWKNAIAGGVAAFALLGILVAGYFVLWSAGIGPVGSLAAQGLFEEGERVVMADFGNSTPDSLLGSVVTDALRIDLAASEAIALVESDAVKDVLDRMQRERNQPLTPELAREVAVRDGIEAVLEGEVGAAGTGYILTATLRAADSGESLASFRRAAEGPDGVIGAIDKLSQDIREKAGESLKSIKGETPLEQVTTTSLAALRKFTEAEARFDAGDEGESLALLEEAIALDSAFAMAHRKIAVTLSNLGVDRQREVEALEAAFRHRDRLTERERLITEATYHNGITGDKDAIMRAYEGVLRIHPDDPAALNNLANVYSGMEDFDRAAELYERAVGGPGTSNTAHSNLVRTRLLQGDMEGARQALAAFKANHPDDPNVQERGFWVHAMAGDWDAAEAVVAEWESNPDLPMVYRVDAHEYRAELAAAQGKIVEARREIRQAQRLAEGQLGPGPAWFYTLYEAYLEIVTGNWDRARQIFAGLEARRLFDEIPLAARSYSLAVTFHSLLGNESQARLYLQRWADEVPPELTGRYDESERKVRRAMLAGAGSNPEALLTAIESHRDLVRCRRCYRFEEATALEAAGRLEESRDVWLDKARNMETNFTVSLLERAWSWERAGHLSSEMGDTASALEAYRSFVTLWENADPELQPRVEAARERIRALEAATSAGD
jgi:tetratricopeptide (TPR) repeat protein